MNGKWSYSVTHYNKSYLPPLLFLFEREQGSSARIKRVIGLSVPSIEGKSSKPKKGRKAMARKNVERHYMEKPRKWPVTFVGLMKHNGATKRMKDVIGEFGEVVQRYYTVADKLGCRFHNYGMLVRIISGPRKGDLIRFNNANPFNETGYKEM